jgi:hypothetical protein
MKKLALILFIVVAKALAGQTDFKSIKTKLSEKYPNVNLDGKLIFVNYWSPSDEESRQRNKQLNSTYHVYEHAKLKGGNKGLIAVAICESEESEATKSILKSDNAANLFTLSLGTSSANTPNNLLFDSEGKVISSGIKSDEIFNSIHKLITR